MLETDDQVLEETPEITSAAVAAPEITVTKVAASSRSFPLIVQVAAITVLLEVALLGFAWWRTGSSKLVWPWLRGDRVVFAPTRIDFGEVPQKQILERQIRVVNLSSKSVTLLGFQPSCRCISLDEFPIVVPAGKPHLLTLKIGTPEKSGAFEHVVKFFSDEAGTAPRIPRS